MQQPWSVIVQDLRISVVAHCGQVLLIFCLCNMVATCSGLWYCAQGVNYIAHPLNRFTCSYRAALEGFEIFCRGPVWIGTYKDVCPRSM